MAAFSLTIHLTDEGAALIVHAFAKVEAGIVAEMSTLTESGEELLESLCKRLGTKGGELGRRG